ncbi:MAG TPA: patatin-like phospholipase family protein [Desulfurivibrionaceae bacterium]|nr:patatin-like phospholipase family protein [Desulfurivibrionaceae bacterium]
MKKLRLTALLIVTTLLAACAAAPPPPPPPPPLEVPIPKVALVLSGGAARGFAHVGVIRALEQEKIPIDLIVGTSVGSLIGAIYASDRNSFELEWTAFQLEKDSLLDYGMFTAITGMGLAKGAKLEEFVKTKVTTANIENLKIPFAAVATDLNLGKRVVLDRGSVVKAVHASSAIPGVFEPVQHQGRMLVDGGVTDNIPIDVAREMGADIVIAVDISENVENHNITNLVDVLLQAVNIMFNENVLSHRNNADVLITPTVGKVAMLDFTQKKQCMQAGIEATQKAMPAIKAVIADWRPKAVAAKSGP